MDKKIPGRPPHLKNIFKKYDPPLYFITFCTHKRMPELANDAFHECFKGFMEKKSGEGIACGEYMIMPDHIHLFLRIDTNQYQLGKTVGFIKKALSKPLRSAGIPMPHWQGQLFRSCHS